MIYFINNKEKSIKEKENKNKRKRKDFVLSVLENKLKNQLKNPLLDLQ